MFNNYLKIAFRNLIKHKFYSIINISGLAIGIAACLLMLLYVQDELSYDKHFENADHIYRLNQEIQMSSMVSHTATVPFPLTPNLVNDFPEISSASKIFRPSSWGNAPFIRIGDQQFVEEDFLFADATVLDIFDFEFRSGNQSIALQAPNHILITESIAQKYFSNEDPIGKTIRYNNSMDFEVAGVLEDIPHNSHLKFNLLASFEGMRELWNNWQGFETHWVWVAAWSYLRLPDEETAARLQDYLPTFVQKHYPATLQENEVKLSLQKVTDIHLHSNLELEFKTNSDMIYVYVFSAIALLILLIACINFMNLATARSAGRAKEVGMRKVLGAYRMTLMKQFLGEAFLLSFISLVLALIIIHLVMPWFNMLTGKYLTIDYFDNWIMLAGLVVLGLFVGIISGSYPAFFLSAFRPVETLKSSISRGAGSSSVRKVLVVGQFVVSITLLICIGIIYNQLDYIRSKNLGFNKEQVVLFDNYGGLQNQYTAFKNELLGDASVLSVSRIGGSIPGAQFGIENAFIPEEWPRDKQQWLSVLFVNHDFVDVLGLELTAGREYSPEFSSDSSTAFMLNEAAVKKFGWEGDPIGRSIDRVQPDGSVQFTGKVIGVVKDFHFRPLHESLKPLVIQFGGGPYAVRMSGTNIPATMAHIQESWKKFVPDWPLNYKFLDDNLDQLYRKDEKLSKIIQYFTMLAIFIACLGLLGLASFTAERRTKEIGVRKVLGATIPSLIVLTSKEFTRLVVIAFIVASPIAYLAADSWLQNFAYRTDIGVGVFLIAGFVALSIALVTVGYHAVKAALLNPVESLRYE